MTDEFRRYWARVAELAKTPDPSSAHYFRLTALFDALVPLDVADFRIRRFTQEEALPLSDMVRARSAFTRGRGDYYAWLAGTFAGQTLLQASLDERTDAAAARNRADRAERLAFVATTYWLTREKLHRIMARTPWPHNDADLYLDRRLVHPSTRSRRSAAATRLTIDAAFARRFQRNGFSQIAPQLLSPTGFTLEKVDRALDWLREARLEVHNDAALIKAVIGLEALFIQERSEPLAHTISERLAFLLGANPDQRAALYRVSKRFYEARSNVVHSGHGDGVSSEVVEQATKLLLMAAQALALNALALSSKDAARSFFEAMRWSSLVTAPDVPFPRKLITALLAQSERSTPNRKARP